MNIAICEDNEKDATMLRLYIEKYLDEIDCRGNIKLYSLGDMLLKHHSQNKFSDIQIVFLDIYMPGTDGIETAKKIREINSDIIIIFTTTSKDHSLKSYSVYALQYLVKPINYPEIKDVLSKCMENFIDSLVYIEVLSERLTVKIFHKDIMYVESFGNEIYIHTVNETIKTFLTLTEFEKQLNSSFFIRTQRSFIVHMRYIKHMKADNFLLKNNKIIPISRNEKTTIKQMYRDYLSALTWSV